MTDDVTARAQGPRLFDRFLTHEILFTESELKARAREMGEQISRDYGDGEPVLARWQGAGRKRGEGGNDKNQRGQDLDR